MTHTSSKPSWLARNWQKVLAITLWLALLGGFAAYVQVSQRSPVQVLQDAITLLQGPFGPALYILIYTLRPLTLFSATVLSLLGGAIWGPLFGTIYIIIGANLSASVAYVFGRVLGQGVLSKGQATGLFGQYASRMRENAFTTVVLMRLVLLPYDLVSYLAGFLRVSFLPFIFATALGSLPATISFSLAGSSVNVSEIFAGQINASVFNPWALAASVLLFVAALLIARVLKTQPQTTA